MAHPSETVMHPNNHYLNVFYNVLFHPIRTYRDIAAEEKAGNNLLLYGLLTIIYISATGPIVSAAGKGAILALLVAEIPLQVVAGVAMWVFMGVVIGVLSYTFTGQSRLKTFLTLSALASLPWIFMGPIALLYQNLGGLSGFLAVLAGLLVWIWSVFLFALAVTMTYRLTAEKTMVILAMPLLMTLIFLAWTTGFVVNILRLLPV